MSRVSQPLPCLAVYLLLGLLTALSCDGNREVEVATSSADRSQESRAFRIELQRNDGAMESLVIPFGADGYSPALRSLVKEQESPWAHARIEGASGATLLVTFKAYPKDHLAFRRSSDGEVDLGLRRGDAQTFISGFELRGPRKVILRSDSRKTGAPPLSVASLPLRIAGVEGGAAEITAARFLEAQATQSQGPETGKAAEKAAKWVPLSDLLSAQGIATTSVLVTAKSGTGSMPEVTERPLAGLILKLNRQGKWKLGLRDDDGIVQGSWQVSGLSISTPSSPRER